MKNLLASRFGETLMDQEATAKLTAGGVHTTRRLSGDSEQAPCQTPGSPYDCSFVATAGDLSIPEIGNRTLDSQEASGRDSLSPAQEKPAEHKATTPRATAIDMGNSSYAIIDLCTTVVEATYPKPQDTNEASSARESSPELSSERLDATKKVNFQSSRRESSIHTQQRSAPNSQHASSQPGIIELQRFDPRYPDLLMQPDSRPISLEQLTSEVKSIYAGLTMVETKCIHVDRAQMAAIQDPNTKLPPDHWQALIALHRTLLHEHHDFFLASQHPSAPRGLRRLAIKYSMPARMWKHGIHSFLELLRRRLLDSIDYMLAFIYLAYQMMALLYETVPAFEDTWIECLGDLGRYRMAIEDNIRDRDIWAGVARSWYTKAADKNPTVGRLYHHLAILARPNALPQMYYYSRSLTCVRPFGNARESILMLLDPILGRTAANFTHALPIDSSFIKSHGYQFSGSSVKEDEPSEEFLEAKSKFLDNLDNHIGRVTAKWKDQGVYIAVTNIAGFFDYGTDDNAMRQAFLIELSSKTDSSGSTATSDMPRTASTIDQQDPLQPTIAAGQIDEHLTQLASRCTFKNAKLLFNDTFAVTLRRLGDKNVLPHVHIALGFLSSLASFTCSTHVPSLNDDVPWADLAAYLNALLRTEQTQSAALARSDTADINALVTAPLFPAANEREDELPLPEDYLVRGLVWVEDYFPKTWFEKEPGEEERYIELASTVKNRVNRVLRLGYQFSKHNRWISYDMDAQKFAAIQLPPRARLARRKS